MEYFDIKLLIQASGSPLFTQTDPLVNPFILRNHRQKKLSVVHYTGVNPVKMGQHSDACLTRITRNYSTSMAGCSAHPGLRRRWNVWTSNSLVIRLRPAMTSAIITLLQTVEMALCRLSLTRQ